MKHVLAFFLGFALCGICPAAETVGRFFFTPAERAQLDLARAQNRAPQLKSAEPAETAPAPQVLTYSGIVRRSDGRSVLWLNNKPLDEKEALSGLAVKGRVRSDGGVTVQVPQTGRNIDLKVGQSVELNSGAVAEGTARNAPEPPAKPAAESERGTPPASERDRPPARKEDSGPAPLRSEEAPRPVR
jgi:hypothetical protein